VTDGRNRTAAITQTDVSASNGVLHAIDKVLLPADKTIVQTAQAVPAFSTLVEAAVAANLQGTLSGAGPFTVFAPTNDAFNAALAELGVSKAALFADTALLTKILTYHVVPARVLKAEVPVGAAITTAEADLHGRRQPGHHRSPGPQGHHATDTLASNGVVHVIDKVILPGDVTLPGQRTLVQQLQAMPQFSTLVEAVVAANLQDALSGAGPLTGVRAHQHGVRRAAGRAGPHQGPAAGQQAAADRRAAVPRAGQPGAEQRRAAGQGHHAAGRRHLQDRRHAGGLVVTDGRNRLAPIGFTDLRVKNGVIHALDKVLLPANQDIVQTAQALPQFSILVEAIVAAGLQDALAAPGPLTVFAPTNDAFAALLAELGVSKADLLANKPLLTQVLTYHVVPGRVLKADVPLNTPIATLQGDSFTVDASLAITDQRPPRPHHRDRRVREQRRHPRHRQGDPAPP
jgi:uncharacterized surface protein with fasciclin (FAS1) repeats